ncbi:MAG: DUF6691 family protein [Pseudomonadota bacterium]|nr:DUF6691 family protein [Pseudomonadota bacterium]
METSPVGKQRKKLAQALLFGLMFGFLLQKGGVAKYHVLEGQLLFTDFTVMKVMMSAILVAMIGLYFLHRTARIKLHIKPTKIGANIIGGLIFGVGFAFAGYCPGTGAAGLGQGDIPALIFMFGLVAGSYLFAEFSETSKKTIEKWGDKGKITFHTLIKVNTGPSVAIMAIVVLSALLVISKLS